MPSAGPSAGVPGVPWSILKLPTAEEGKERGGARRGLDQGLLKSPRAQASPSAPIPVLVLANPGPQWGSILRDPVPLPGAPAASALTDPGEGRRQDPALLGAPAPRGSGKGEGQGTRAKGGPNGTGRAALAGQRQLPGPMVLCANRKARRRTGPQEGLSAPWAGCRHHPGIPVASGCSRDRRCGGYSAPGAPVFRGSAGPGPRPSAARIGSPRGASALKPW